MGTQWLLRTTPHGTALDADIGRHLELPRNSIGALHGHANILLSMRSTCVSREEISTFIRGSSTGKFLLSLQFFFFFVCLQGSSAFLHRTNLLKVLPAFMTVFISWFLFIFQTPELLVRLGGLALEVLKSD